MSPDIPALMQVLFTAAAGAGIVAPAYELRALKAGREKTISGCFTDPSRAAAAAAQIDGRAIAPGIYVTLNPILPDLVARADNRLKSHAETTTGDKEIVRRLWMLIDLDAKRPAGISASDTEHDAALAMAVEVRAYLRESDWPDPIYADSGNGAHLLYRIDLPNDDGATQLVKRCLEALHAKFGTASIGIDQTVFNAARISKIYGTHSRKGDPTPDRPHRRARILELPTDLRAVSVEMLEYLASAVPVKPVPARPENGTYPAFDLRAWLATHGISYGAEKAHDGTGWVAGLEACPFSDAHTSGACIGQRASGAVFASCRHDTCKGKGWTDLRARYEPTRLSVVRQSSPPPHEDSENEGGVPSPAQGNTPAPRPGLPQIALVRASELALSLWSEPLPPAIPTGIAALDAIIGGLRSESTAILNAPTGRGKTGLVIQISRFVSASRPVVYLTSELSPRQVIARFAAQSRGVPWLSLYEEGRTSAAQIAKDVSGLELYPLELRRGMVVSDALNQLSDKLGKAPVIVLDYLQSAARKLAPSDMRIATAALSDGIATWAKDNKSTSLVISAVARNWASGDEGKRTSELATAAKDSGEVDYDAAVLMFLHTEDAPEGSDVTNARLHVAKNRFGRTGVVGLSFVGPIGTFDPRPEATLRGLERDVYEAIANGAQTKNEVEKVVEGKRHVILKVVDRLIGLEIVEGPPLRVRRWK